MISHLPIQSQIRCEMCKTLQINHTTCFIATLKIKVCLQILRGATNKELVFSPE